MTALLLFATGLHAQTVADPAAAPIISQNQLVILLIVTALIVAFASLVMAVSVLFLIRQKKEEIVPSTETAAAPAREPLITWAKINKVLTRAVPIEKEADIDLGHSFDGIRELDNRLPPWWLYGFYMTIIFSVGYMYYFHIQKSWTSTGQYQEEMQVEGEKVTAYLKTKADDVNEATVTLADASGVLAGKEIFLANCQACHGAEGQGGVGPNFTDNYWIHGSKIADLFKVIKNGVPEKGMISWSSTLRPVEMQNVASFILSLQGTNPPNQKEPQGVPATEETAPADTTAGKMTALNP